MRGLVPFVAWHVLLWGWLASAQQDSAPAPKEPAQPPSEAPAEPPSERVQEAPLPIYMMEDETGKLRPALGWKFKDLMELYQRAEGRKQTDRPPRYILQLMSATGTAKADVAELTIQLKVWVGDERVRVPLHLDQAILRKVEYQGTGQSRLQLGEQGEGYVLWIHGEPEQEHQLTLSVLVPLATVGDETRLRLFVPRATIANLRLTVPVAGAVGEVSGGAILSPPSAGEGETTEFNVQAFGGDNNDATKFNDFQLAWRKAQNGQPETRSVLKAEGTLLVNVDRRSVTTKANLKVRGHGGPFDRFRLSLPKGAELIPGNGLGYSVTPVAGNEAVGGEVVVEVRRDKKLPEPMDVRLTTRQSREAAGLAGWFELGGFEVIDAVQQSGHVAVSTVGEWNVRCVPGRGVRQVEQLPQEFEKELENEGVVARFEYFSQPFSLAARVLEVKTRIRVEPVYRLMVDEDRARLEADLKYTVSGATVFALNVDLPDWELDEVGPDNVVAAADVAPDASGALLIPLLQPSVGEIAVSLRAHQEIQPDTSSISLSLPRPQADLLSPAELTIVPAENVELTPDAERMLELAPQQVPFSYRVEGAKAVFAAGFKVHAQRITVGVTSEVGLLEAKESLRQTLAYDIAYEPLDKLTLDVPRSLAGSEKLEVLLEGQPLSPVPLPDQPDAPDPSSPIRMQVALPKARIGKCELEVRYPIQMAQLPPEGNVVRPIPLVMPGEGELSRNEVIVTAPEGIKVGLQSSEGPWTRSEDGSGSLKPGNGPRLCADKRASEVVLRIDREDHETTVVERAWIQTWLTDNGRHERAVFRFTTDQKELQLALPAGFDARQVEVVVGPESVEDRESVNVQLTAEGHLVIPLPDDSNRRSRWLEARYAFSDPRPGPGSLSIALPRLEGNVWVQRMYWELVLPQNEHVIVGPRGFTPEWRWGWNGSYCGRNPLMDQAQLEAWSGARRRTGVPKASSRYLFSAAGPVTLCELRTASRWWIVLGASSAVLAAGLLLIYVPASRHPAALFAVAVVLLSGGVLYPGPALLASQAAGLGLALALSAALLHRALGGSRGRLVRRETSSSVLDRGSTQAQPRPPAAAKDISTESAPGELPIPTPDSSP